MLNLKNYYNKIMAPEGALDPLVEATKNLTFHVSSQKIKKGSHVETYKWSGRNYTKEAGTHKEDGSREKLIQDTFGEEKYFRLDISAAVPSTIHWLVTGEWLGTGSSLHLRKLALGKFERDSLKNITFRWCFTPTYALAVSNFVKHAEKNTEDFKRFDFETAMCKFVYYVLTPSKDWPLINVEKDRDAVIVNAIEKWNRLAPVRYSVFFWESRIEDETILALKRRGATCFHVYDEFFSDKDCVHDCVLEALEVVGKEWQENKTLLPLRDRKLTITLKEAPSKDEMNELIAFVSGDWNKVSEGKRGKKVIEKEDVQSNASAHVHSSPLVVSPSLVVMVPPILYMQRRKEAPSQLGKQAQLEGEKREENKQALAFPSMSTSTVTSSKTFSGVPENDDFWAKYEKAVRNSYTTSGSFKKGYDPRRETSTQFKKGDCRKRVKFSTENTYHVESGSLQAAVKNARIALKFAQNAFVKGGGSISKIRECEERLKLALEVWEEAGCPRAVVKDKT
jgi:hypothetical protein